MAVEDAARGGVEALLKRAGGWLGSAIQNRKPVEMTFTDAETIAGMGSKIAIVYRVSFIPFQRQEKRYAFELQISNPKAEPVTITKMMLRLDDSPIEEPVAWSTSGSVTIPSNLQMLAEALQMQMSAGYISEPMPPPMRVGAAETCLFRVTCKALGVERGVPVALRVFGSHWRTGTSVKVPMTGNEIPLKIRLVPEG